MRRAWLALALLAGCGTGESSTEPACDPGYAGLGEACVDIDECATDNGGCGNATYWTCANNAGAAPSCSCIGSGCFAPPGVIAAGGDHVCVLLDTGGLKCWGWDDQGQLGDSLVPNEQKTPVDVLGLSTGVVAVGAGDSHTCAVLAAGAVKCWGDDYYGQLGDGGSNTDKATPVDVVGLSTGVVAVAAGFQHSCALLETGALECWGSDFYGQLGDDASTTDQGTPVPVAGTRTRAARPTWWG